MRNNVPNVLHRVTVVFVRNRYVVNGGANGDGDREYAGTEKVTQVVNLVTPEGEIGKLLAEKWLDYNYKHFCTPDTSVSFPDWRTEKVSAAIDLTLSYQQGPQTESVEQGVY